MQTPDQAPICLLDEQHLPALLSGMLVVPHFKENLRPSSQTHVWLNMRMVFVQDACDKAGLDGSVISQQGVAPRVYLPLTAGLRDAIAANALHPASGDSHHLDHVIHMMKFLEPGGVLSVITSQTWAIGAQKKQVEFAEFLSDIGAEITPIAKGAFKKSGTMVGTLHVTARAPALKLDLDEVTNSAKQRLRP